MSLTPDQHEDLIHLRETMRWPCWPYCPVKRDEELGTVFDGPNGERTVYLCNMFTYLAGEIDLETVEKIEYKNSYDLLVDGWIVD